MDEKYLEKMERIRADFRRDFGMARIDAVMGDDLYERPKSQPAERKVTFDDITGDDIFVRPGTQASKGAGMTAENNSAAAGIIGRIRAELSSWSEKHPQGFAILGENRHDGSFEISTTLKDSPRFEISKTGAVTLNGQPQESAAAALAAAEQQIAAAARKYIARGPRAGF